MKREKTLGSHKFMQYWLKIIWKLKVIWRIIRDRQIVVITESCRRTYLNWYTRSIEDVCQMCQITIDKAKEALDKK